jgi:predicted PurR-regulated permease PerM
MLLLTKRTCVVSAVVTLFIAIVGGLATAIDVCMIAFMGLLFAVFLQTLSRFVDRHSGLGASWSLVVVVISLFGMIGAIGWALVPTIATQIQQFRSQLPEAIISIREQLRGTAWGAWILEQLPKSDQIWPRPQALLSRATGMVTSTIGGLGVPVMVFFIGLMLAAQPLVYLNGLLRLIPNRLRPRTREILIEIGSTLQSWLIAKISAMLIVGVLTWLGLICLNVELAATMAFLAAILTFIPNFGPIISAIPAVLLGMSQSPFVAIGVVVLYVVIQLLESYVITPLVQYRALSLPPALVLVSQLAASAWLGIWGLALATPLLAVTIVLIRLLYIQDVLHETNDLQDVEPISA